MGPESPHLPWIKAALRCISTMIPRNDLNNQTKELFTAIHRMLMAVCPGADINLNDLQGTNMQVGSGTEYFPIGNDRQHGSLESKLEPSGVGNQASLFPYNQQAADSREQSVSDLASQWGLSHLTQGEADWNFNFPTVDLESFLAIDSTGTDEGFFGFPGSF